MRHALVICTYNRPERLRQTLRSVAGQSFAGSLLVVVVEKVAKEEQRPLRVEDYPFELTHVCYDGPPSAARQRNAGLDRLPRSVEYVFFLDDDVELRPAYFEALCAVLDHHPEVGGVGGVLVNKPRRARAFLKRFFLLVSERPGQVLPSGKATPAQLLPAASSAASLTSTQWLSTCSSLYRRSLLERHRFDEEVPGALLEDLDLSYRVGRDARLVVEPKARLVHHQSVRNRPAARAYAFMRTVQRYWFVEKNIEHPLRKAAFWWATLGQALARLASRQPEAKAALRGLGQGARAVLRRSHPLLQRDPS